jgi:hypothetical protein
VRSPLVTPFRQYKNATVSLDCTKRLPKHLTPLKVSNKSTFANCSPDFPPKFYISAQVPTLYSIPTMCRVTVHVRVCGRTVRKPSIEFCRNARRSRFSTTRRVPCADAIRFYTMSRSWCPGRCSFVPGSRERPSHW